jgi:polysaccharide export outer membrane protein
MYRSVLCACLLALTLGACSDLHGDEVIGQATAGDKIAFDVVKIDDAVITTLAAQKPPPFESRFKKYVPAPDLKIAVGDTVSTVIWESAANGLFGNSLTELNFPGGAAAKALTSTEASSPLAGVPSTPGGLAVSPDLMMALFGTGTDNDREAGETATARVAALARSGRTNGEGGADSGGGTGGFGASKEKSPFALQDRSFAPEKVRSRRVEKLLDTASQSGRAGTRIPDQQVGSDGAISIPYAGRLPVAGRTPTEVEHAIEGALKDKALDPQVLVVVKRSPANAVSVAGEVVGGARVPLSPGGDRLLQVIAAAGGAHAPVHDTFVRLSRNGVTASIPLATLVSDPAQDIYAEPGDVLTLVRRPQTFSVFGATGKNSAISFNSNRLSLSEALAKAGGLLDQRADPRAVFLFRYEPDSVVRALGQPLASNAPAGISPIAYRLDLSEAKSYLLAQRFPVHDKDVIFVANSRYEDVYRFFSTLAQITGPIQTGLITCNYSASC